MKFEEQFPSLKNKLELYDPEDDLIGRSIKDIQENCLDKEKVKEAIEAIEEQFWKFGTANKMIAEKLLKGFREGLGL